MLAHNSDLEVTSVVNAGTTISFTLDALPRRLHDQHRPSQVDSAGHSDLAAQSKRENDVSFRGMSFAKSPL